MRTSDIKDRIRKPSLLNRLCSPEEAVAAIKPEMTVGLGGFTPAGSPRVVPLAVAREHAGKALNLTLLTGASIDSAVEDALADSGIISRRLPYQRSTAMRKLINQDLVRFNDLHLSKMPQAVRYGHLPSIDVAIIEAVSVTEDGHIIPTTSVGNSPTFARLAETVIVEINLTESPDLQGIHDIYIPKDPPGRSPIPLLSPRDRIGKPFIEVDQEKVRFIVPSGMRCEGANIAPVDDVFRKMADNLCGFLEDEVRASRLPGNLLPLQAGVGNVANAVLEGLTQSRFTGLTIYAEVLQDGVLSLFRSGKLEAASGCSLTLSSKAYEDFYSDLDFFKKRVLLRPQEISNNPEVIRRLGVIAINTAVEADILGNVNSTHVMGSQMLNGIGGSGDFASNACLSIFVTPSTALGGRASTIVPMLPHIDHTEHDVHVIMTEMGVADIRGLSPRERAPKIIENCVHPTYKGALMEHWERVSGKRPHHTPIDLERPFRWHQNLLEYGRMLPD